MNRQIDLILLPLVRFSGQDQPHLPGLYVPSRPRRTARSRNRDKLILWLAFESRPPVTETQIGEILSRLSHTYYQTSGSVTAAQRAVAESLNEYLLNRNLQSSGAGQQAIGVLSQAVLRESRLYLGISGPTHAYLISAKETQYLYDLQLAGRGLGLNRATSIRYIQVNLEPNIAVVLAPQPPATWTPETLQTASSQGPESLRRKLLTQAGPDLSALLLQAQAGTGQIHLIRAVRPAQPRLVSPTQPAAKSELLESETFPSHPSPIQEASTATSQSPDRDIRSATDSADIPLPPSGTPIPRKSSSPASAQRSRASAFEPATRRESPGINLRPLTSGLAAIGHLLDGFIQRIGQTGDSLLRRVLPDSSIFSLPSSTMIIVAVAIPVVVVAVTTMVYFQRGRASQFQVLFSQALDAAKEARVQSEPQNQREAWDSTIAILDKAEAYQITSESKALRSEAQGVLDSLDHVERLNFQPALTSELKEDANISRLVAIENDLYLLNATEGLVLRATLTSNGYILDPTFQCGPGPYGGQIVGAIIGIAPIPRGNDLRATLLGIDANGNLLFCLPGDSPLAMAMTPPDTNWGTPLGITQDTGDLYILDPQTNAVWIFRGIDVSKQPRFFFGDDIPPMQDVIDLAVNSEDLYLLHADSHLTICTYRTLPESPTRCDEPAVFTDPRAGRQSEAVIEGTRFTQILFSPPPDPSIFLFDPEAPSIYHFSVRLTLQRQYRSQSSIIEKPATAFAVNRGERLIYLATGSQVYYASIP